ncbi:MAG: cytidine deaminase [Parasporobacterium sp.]|nr:cytidine deaminase [Parasporobacterium sp.]
MNKKDLVNAAKEVMKNSYSPYSDFKVGAALLSKDGKVYKGCNIENAAYGPSNCAERTAIFKAVSEGVKDFEAIAIVGGKSGIIEDFCPPCGVCRQVMAEFCHEDFKIILGGKDDDIKEFSLGELLPESFGL